MSFPLKHVFCEFKFISAYLIHCIWFFFLLVVKPVHVDRPYPQVIIKKKTQYKENKSKTKSQMRKILFRRIFISNDCFFFFLFFMSFFLFVIIILISVSL